MKTQTQPIYLLADSQPLFASDAKLLTHLHRCFVKAEPTAAYLGAANGDEAAFYDLFAAAMARMHLHDHRHLRADASPDDLRYLAEADLIVLAGGDARRAWDAFAASGAHDVIVAAHARGAVLLGVSAGAQLLGKRAWSEEHGNIFRPFGFVEAVVSTHEGEDWPRLRRALLEAGEDANGVGLAHGGALIYYPTATAEPMYRAATELVVTDGEVREAILLPGTQALLETRPVLDRSVLWN